jgi:uncharacterized protein YceK
MIKRLVFVFFIVLFSGCASFHETYKPLYQAKPEIEDLK